MKKHKRLYSLLALGALLLLMSACAPVISSGGSSLSPGQVLQNSAKAMKQLKSAHFDLKVASNPQLSKLFGQQNIDTVIDKAKAFQASVDLWIDETNFYAHRAELKSNLNEDLSSLNNSTTPGATPTVPPLSGLTTSFDSVTDLSNFNQPVTITPPANAIPTDNLISIFG